MPFTSDDDIQFDPNSIPIEPVSPSFDPNSIPISPIQAKSPDEFDPNDIPVEPLAPQRYGPAPVPSPEEINAIGAETLGNIEVLQSGTDEQGNLRLAYRAPDGNVYLTDARQNVAEAGMGRFNPDKPFPTQGASVYRDPKTGLTLAEMQRDQSYDESLRANPSNIVLGLGRNVGRTFDDISRGDWVGAAGELVAFANPGMLLQVPGALTSDLARRESATSNIIAGIDPSSPLATTSSPIGRMYPSGLWEILTSFTKPGGIGGLIEEYKKAGESIGVSPYRLMAYDAAPVGYWRASDEIAKRKLVDAYKSAANQGGWREGLDALYGHRTEWNLDLKQGFDQFSGTKGIITSAWDKSQDYDLAASAKLPVSSGIANFGYQAIFDPLNVFGNGIFKLSAKGLKEASLAAKVLHYTDVGFDAAFFLPKIASEATGKALGTGIGKAVGAVTGDSTAKYTGEWIFGEAGKGFGENIIQPYVWGGLVVVTAQGVFDHDMFGAYSAAIDQTTRALGLPQDNALWYKIAAVPAIYNSGRWGFRLAGAGIGKAAGPIAGFNAQGRIASDAGGRHIFDLQTSSHHMAGAKAIADFTSELQTHAENTVTAARNTRVADAALRLDSPPVPTAVADLSEVGAGVVVKAIDAMLAVGRNAVDGLSDPSDGIRLGAAQKLVDAADSVGLPLGPEVFRTERAQRALQLWHDTIEYYLKGSGGAASPPVGSRIKDAVNEIPTNSSVVLEWMRSLPDFGYKPVDIVNRLNELANERLRTLLGRKSPELVDPRELLKAVAAQLKAMPIRQAVDISGKATDVSARSLLRAKVSALPDSEARKLALMFLDDDPKAWHAHLDSLTVDSALGRAFTPNNKEWQAAEKALKIIQSAARTLEQDGTWKAQGFYMPSMLSKNAAGFNNWPVARLATDVVRLTTPILLVTNPRYWVYNFGTNAMFTGIMNIATRGPRTLYYVVNPKAALEDLARYGHTNLTLPSYISTAHITGIQAEYGAHIPHVEPLFAGAQGLGGRIAGAHPIVGTVGKILASPLWVPYKAIKGAANLPGVNNFTSMFKEGTWHLADYAAGYIYHRNRMDREFLTDFYASQFRAQFPDASDEAILDAARVYANRDAQIIREKGISALTTDAPGIQHYGPSSVYEGMPHDRDMAYKAIEAAKGDRNLAVLNYAAASGDAEAEVALALAKALEPTPPPKAAATAAEAPTGAKPKTTTEKPQPVEESLDVKGMLKWHQLVTDFVETAQDVIDGLYPRISTVLDQLYILPDGRSLRKARAEAQPGHVSTPEQARQFDPTDILTDPKKRASILDQEGPFRAESTDTESAHRIAVAILSRIFQDTNVDTDMLSAAIKKDLRLYTQGNNLTDAQRQAVIKYANGLADFKAKGLALVPALPKIRPDGTIIVEQYRYFAIVSTEVREQLLDILRRADGNWIDDYRALTDQHIVNLTKGTPVEPHVPAVTPSEVAGPPPEVPQTGRIDPNDEAALAANKAMGDDLLRRLGANAGVIGAGGAGGMLMPNQSEDEKKQNAMLGTGLGAGIVGGAMALKNPAFARWFRGSKAVGQDGLPKLLYRGDRGPAFGEYDFGKLGQSSRHPTAKMGYFFTDNARVGDDFISQMEEGTIPPRPLASPTANPFVDQRWAEGARSTPAYVAIKNPYEMEMADFRNMVNRSDAGQVAIFKNNLIEQGYDGVHIIPEQGALERGPMNEEFAVDTWIAFEPNQIQSAITPRRLEAERGGSTAMYSVVPPVALGAAGAYAGQTEDEKLGYGAAGVGLGTALVAGIAGRRPIIKMLAPFTDALKSTFAGYSRKSPIATNATNVLTAAPEMRTLVDELTAKAAVVMQEREKAASKLGTVARGAFDPRAGFDNFGFPLTDVNRHALPELTAAIDEYNKVLEQINLKRAEIEQTVPANIDENAARKTLREIPDPIDPNVTYRTLDGKPYTGPVREGADGLLYKADKPFGQAADEAEVGFATRFEGANRPEIQQRMLDELGQADPDEWLSQARALKHAQAGRTPEGNFHQTGGGEWFYDEPSGTWQQTRLGTWSQVDPNVGGELAPDTIAAWRRKEEGIYLSTYTDRVTKGMEWVLEAPTPEIDAALMREAGRNRFDQFASAAWENFYKSRFGGDQVSLNGATGRLRPMTGEEALRMNSDLATKASTQAEKASRAALFGYDDHNYLDYVLHHVSPYQYWSLRHFAMMGRYIATHPRQYYKLAQMIRFWWQENEHLPPSQRLTVRVYRDPETGEELRWNPLQLINPFLAGIVERSVARGGPNTNFGEELDWLDELAAWTSYSPMLHMPLEMARQALHTYNGNSGGIYPTKEPIKLARDQVVQLSLIRQLSGGKWDPGGEVRQLLWNTKELQSETRLTVNKLAGMVRRGEITELDAEKAVLSFRTGQPNTLWNKTQENALWEQGTHQTLPRFLGFSVTYTNQERARLTDLQKQYDKLREQGNVTEQSRKDLLKSNADLPISWMWNDSANELRRNIFFDLVTTAGQSGKADLEKAREQFIAGKLSVAEWRAANDAYKALESKERAEANEFWRAPTYNKYGPHDDYPFLEVQSNYISKMYNDLDAVSKEYRAKLDANANDWISRKITGQVWKERDSELDKAKKTAEDAIKAKYAEMGVSPIKSANPTPQQNALEHYYNIQPQTMADGKTIDWDGFERARSIFLNALPPEMRNYITSETQKNWTEADRYYYQNVSPVMSKYYDMPKYTTGTPEEHKRWDQANSVFGDAYGKAMEGKEDNAANRRVAGQAGEAALRRAGLTQADLDQANKAENPERKKFYASEEMRIVREFWGQTADPKPYKEPTTGSGAASTTRVINGGQPVTKADTDASWAAYNELKDRDPRKASEYYADNFDVLYAFANKVPERPDPKEVRLRNERATILDGAPKAGATRAQWEAFLGGPKGDYATAKRLNELNEALGIKTRYETKPSTTTASRPATSMTTPARPGGGGGGGGGGGSRPSVPGSAVSSHDSAAFTRKAGPLLLYKLKLYWAGQSGLPDRALLESIRTELPFGVSPGDSLAVWLDRVRGIIAKDIGLAA